MHAEITDLSGSHRLTIRDEPVPGGYNFHSLVWSVRNGDVWTDKIVISKADFQPGTKHRRWVQELYSFDPDTGRAIIQVAEGDVPDGILPANYTYSWREWDLPSNREVRFLRACKSPFDKYEPST